MRIEVVAVGTELLLGQIADTNSAWLGEQLAASGVHSHFHQAVGDNRARIVLALRTALARSDGAIVCGGLGPTQDDITRESIAEVMNAPLVRDQAIADRIAAFFSERGRVMSDNNARQADVPQGASVIEQVGTAPGLICPVGNKVIYAVPGVPHEMEEMFLSGVRPDLQRRMAERGERGVILSRVLRTWGSSESALAAALADRVEALDAVPPASEEPGGDGHAAGTADPVTIAFLASGIEGIKVRLTARADTREEAAERLDAEEVRVRAAITERLGDIVFGIDEQSMEQAVGDLLSHHGLTLGLAESLTGGLIASRVVSVPGASAWFRGGVVSYASEVKYQVLGVPEGPVVTEEAARAMAVGARAVLGSDVGLAVTGVAGPEEQEGQPAGTVFVGLALPGPRSAAGAADVRSLAMRLPGDRERVRQFTAISALDVLRRALLSRSGD